MGNVNLMQSLGDWGRDVLLTPHGEREPAQTDGTGTRDRSLLTPHGERERT